MDAKTRAWLDQEAAWTTDMVRRHGWAIQYVGGSCTAPGCNCPPDDEPSFAYTIGLHGLNHPELLVFGLSQSEAAAVLNGLGERICHGKDLVPGQAISVEGFPRRIVPEVLPNPERILFSANSYYELSPDTPVRALQLSYDDTEGRFPWDEEYAHPALQPRPGTFSA